MAPGSDDRLVGTRFAEVRRVVSTGSTNADLLADALSGAGECALIAEFQDAGRGRLDRRWVAPPGASLLMSVLVRPPFPRGGPHLLGVALGVAAVDAVADLTGVEVGLKWPNDVVTTGSASSDVARAPAADLKLGGLLAELASDTSGTLLAAVLGIGMNVAWQDGFPAELAATASSLHQLGARVGRDELAVAILGRLDARGRLVDEASVRSLIDDYRERCVTIGRRVRVVLPEGEMTGTAVDVAYDATLVVRDVRGDVHPVNSGDVVHLRPVD